MADFGNIMSRLQGIKKVNPRRVMPGAEFLEELAPPEMDVGGTAPPLPNFANFQSPEVNLPEADMGGALTSQAYDVRANTANPPPEETEDEGFGGTLRKLGSNLWNSFKEGWTPGISDETREKMGIAQPQTPPIETAQVDVQEGLPPVTASQEASEPWYSTLGSSLSRLVKGPSDEVTAQNRRLVEDAQLRTQGHEPEAYRAQQAQTHANTQEEVLGKIDKALENPSSTAVYGASDIVANQPELNAAFKEVTGMDFTEEIARQTSEYEKVLDDLDNEVNLQGDGYSDQEARIKQRILDNQATDADKFYVGLAVLMPLILGAFFGKEAALGALGGSAKGFADILGRKQKDTMENEKLLADIGVNKGNLALKKADINLKRAGLPAEIQKNLPKDKNEHLVGKREVTWTAPDGSEQKGVEIKPGLVAQAQFVKDKEELKEMRKEAQEISTAINPTKEINKLTGEVIDIAGRMKDKSLLHKALAAYVSGKSPALGTKLGEEIDYNGRKVNSYVVLEHKLKLLVDAYRQAKGMRALTNTVQEHIDSLFRNPAASFQSYEDTVDQMLYTRDLAQDRLLNTVSSAGFVPEFVIEQLQPTVKSTYNKLNTRQGEREASELLRE